MADPKLGLSVRLWNGTVMDVDRPTKPELGHPLEVHIGGTPYVHVSNDPDGTWVYAPRDVKHR
jgi:hypothetical protein